LPLKERHRLTMKRNEKVARKRMTRKGARRPSIRLVSAEIGPLEIIPPKDLVDARKEIAKMVRESSTRIVGQLIELAATGEVGPAKYLFEMVGLYPVTDETASQPDNSLAYTLLQRMGLPREPIDDAEGGSHPGDSVATNSKI
jgi:hypothetical protein